MWANSIAPNWDEWKGKKLATVDGSANRKDRRAFAGLDASGGWFPEITCQPSAVISGFNEHVLRKRFEIQSSTAPTDKWLYEYLHHDWNHWLTSSWSDQNLPVIYSYHVNRNVSFAVAQHNMFKLAPTSNNEPSLNPHSWWVPSSNKKCISECKQERNQLNNTKLRIQQLGYSGASGCGTALLH